MAEIQRLIFDILTRDRASEGFAKAGHAAQAAAGDVSSLTKRLDDVGRKSVQARVALAGNKEALAQIDRLDAKLVSLDRRSASARLTVEGASRAIAEISAVDVALDKVGNQGGSAASAAAGLSKLSGPSGMGAAIAAGTVLSPMITTLAFGLGGFGLAAAGVAAPIEKAAKKAGGLQANMHTLNAEQQVVAKGLLGLGGQFHKFEGQLQPEVLKTFSSGLHLAGNLLHDVEPVAKATGTALNGMLGSIDKEFQSGTWQQFFQFMARTAGPDIKLLTTDVLGLVHALPTILETLQPVASGILDTIGKTEKLTGDIADLSSKLVTLNHAVPKQGAGDNNPLKWLSDQNLIHGAKFLNDLLPRLLQHAAEGAGAVQKMGDKAATAGPKMGDFGGTVYTTGQNAGTAGAKLQTMAQAVLALNTAESKSLDNQLAYTNALLASRQGAIDLRTALKASGDRIGLHTAAQANSFSTANTYIGDLEQTAKQSWASGKGTQGAIAAIRGGLPILEQAKSHSKLYWEEVQTLVSWLHKLENQKSIHDVVHLSGSGAWTFSLGGTGSFPSRNIKGRGATGVKGAAAGVWLVGEEGPELAYLPQGTHVLPAKPTAKVMGGLAGGTGLVPSYAGSAGGLKPWGQDNFNATIMAMTQAFVRAGKAQQAAFSSVSGPASYGVTRWAPLILKVLAMLGQSSANLGAVEHRMQQESGGNPYAINLTDSNAAAGDPSRGLMQTIGSTFARYRSWSLPNNIYNPEANIFAGLNYALHAYAGRSLASVMLQPGGYDNGGWLQPGATLAINKTGRPEQVIPPGGGELAGLLAEIADGIAELIAVNRAGPRAFGDTLNGAVRSSAYASMYGSR